MDTPHLSKFFQFQSDYNIPFHLHQAFHQLSQLAITSYKRLLPVEIIDGKLDEDETVYCNQIEIGKILINEEYPFALIKFSNENFNKDLTLKSKNGSFKIFIPEWLKI